MAEMNLNSALDVLVLAARETLLSFSKRSAASHRRRHSIMSLQAVRPARRAVICGCSPYASSSRLRLPAVRTMSFVANRPQESVPFFTPPSTSPVWSSFKPTSTAHDAKGKGKVPQTPGGEEEVDDGEWEMRIGRSLIPHGREEMCVC